MSKINGPLQFVRPLQINGPLQSGIERFWRSAKCERIYLNEYQNISELITDVDDYIDFYNHRRFHETLNYKKPMDVYQESIKLNQNKKKAS